MGGPLWAHPPKPPRPRMKTEAVLVSSGPAPSAAVASSTTSAPLPLSYAATTRPETVKGPPSRQQQWGAAAPVARKPLRRSDGAARDADSAHVQSDPHVQVGLHVLDSSPHAQALHAPDAPPLGRPPAEGGRPARGRRKRRACSA